MTKKRIQLNLARLQITIDTLEKSADDFDKFSAERATENQLCLFCKAEKWNGTGIVHTIFCPLNSLRLVISDFKRWRPLS
jgi:hypothetical protein